MAVLMVKKLLYYQDARHSLSKEEAIKRFILLAMVLVMTCLYLLEDVGHGGMKMIETDETAVRTEVKDMTAIKGMKSDVRKEMRTSL